MENDVLFYEIPFEDAVLKQKVMTESVPYNQNRELFFSMAEELGIRKALEKWYGPDPVSFLKTRKAYTKYVIARQLRKIRAGKTDLRTDLKTDLRNGLKNRFKNGFKKQI